MAFAATGAAIGRERRAQAVMPAGLAACGITVPLPEKPLLAIDLTHLVMSNEVMIRYATRPRMRAYAYVRRAVITALPSLYCFEVK
jgi:hypothetical protein